MNAPPKEKAAPEVMTQEAAEDESNEILEERAKEVRTFDALQAAAAQAGHTLMRAAGGYTLGRWGWMRHYSDLGDVRRALLKMGVRE